MTTMPGRTIEEYHTFLASKMQVRGETGLHVADAEVNPMVYGHQRDAIVWALRRGRALIAMSFGLGKTVCQVEMMRIIHERTGGKTLVICPLGVKHQFQYEDGPMLGVRFQYVRDDAEVEAADTPYLITNYERVRDGSISPAHFVAVSLDEGSVLRSFGSKTYQQFSEIFERTTYRFVCTATPSPNRFKELIHYADFLGIMDSGQALTRWFKRDSEKAGNLTLMPSQEKEFWLWVASWALFVQYPSDLGYSDEGYVLPDLQVHWHRIDTDHERAWKEMDSWGQRFLFLSSANGIQQAIREKRATLDSRVMAAAAMVEADDPNKHWLIWHHLEDERHAICAALPEAVDVFGSQPLEEREQRILDFAHGQHRILAVKPEIAGSGCNFQRHCHANIFVGVNYQFQDFIQAVHRTHRFQQAHPVEVHIIYTEAEDEIVDVLKRKWAQHDELVKKMTDIVKRYGLTSEALKTNLERTMGIRRQEYKGGLFTAVNNDCVYEVRQMGDNSVDLLVTSIPFGNQYEYSASYNDFGHNPSNADFYSQMEFLVPELLRVLKPGRVAAIHVKDRLMYGNVTGLGMPSVSPFSDHCTVAFTKGGFIFTGRITIVTDVVRENNQTYRLGWSEMTKDGSKMGVGMPEYFVLYRKLPSDTSRAYADTPVRHDKADYTRQQWQVDASAYWRSSGNRLIRPEEMLDMETNRIYRWFAEWSKQNVYDYETHIKLGKVLEENGRLPATFMLFAPGAPEAFADNVWSVHDYTRMRSLNSNQSQRREENHVCPLPMDLVQRMIERFSNPGELVFDPFGGLMTVPYVAMQMDRRGYGVELNTDYWQAGVNYCRALEVQKATPTLFDMLAFEAKETAAVNAASNGADGDGAQYLEAAR